MNKKNVYLVQAGCLYGNTYYLPYAVGMLAAFAFNDERIKEAYELKRIIYSLEDVDESIRSLENPAFVGFSNSIWNYNYNLVYARKLKEAYPDCIIQFGGHHVPPTTRYLDDYPFIDLLSHRKGEESFRDVLLALLDGSDFSSIPNISYRLPDGKAVQTEETKITISDYPSPYLTGVFDDIIKDSEHRFSCVLETNRGCPYNCCYCDWGELNSKVRLFPLEKVMAELEWMSEHKMEFVYCVDANFGMFERDEIIAQKLVELKETNGYPNRLQVSYAKCEQDRVFRINKMLADHGIGKGATLALQSLSPAVLENVGRANISKEEYSKQIARYRDAGISTYTELILGLPGETYETFTHGLCEILELGQHSSVSAYYCELLPNSTLSSPEYIKKFKIKTVSTSLNQYHCESMDDVLSGFSTIIVGTETLSVEDWIRANEFSTCVQSMHHFGIMQCAAMYVRHEYGVSYYDFYSRLFDFIENESVFCKNVFRRVSSVLRNFVDGKGGLTYQNDIFGKITYPLEEAVFLLCLYHSDEFYGEMTAFLKRYVTDKKMLSQLMAYQKAVVLRPCVNNYEAEYEYDFAEYFGSILRNACTPLKKGSVKYRFSTVFETNDWVEYAREIIWYGRRNSRMMYSSAPNRIDKI
ncbi:MAG: radical SAM protein [Clostridia bacterium]|nr:radical SAM protein [Clostridia bacterium]